MSAAGYPRLKRAAKTLYVPGVIAAMRPWRRWHPQARYIGITGSAGKTTTKDLLVAALGGAPFTVGNSDSNNQLYGTARTLLNVRRRTRYVVQEVGAGGEGGVGRICELLRPDIAVVLNVGLDHHSLIGDIDAIAAEKGRLVAALPSTGLAVLCADDPRVAAMAERSTAAVLTFGFSSGAVRGRVLPGAWDEGMALEVTSESGQGVVRSALTGRQHANNLLAAVATTVALGMPLASISTRLAGVGAMRGRANLLHVRDGIRLIRDDWKAPAWSLPQALEQLRGARGARRYAVLGTLSDFRGTSRRAYRTAVELALDCADRVLIVGARSSHASLFRESHPGRVTGCATVRDACALLAAELQGGEVVLLKGSNRADHLARIVVMLEGARAVGCWRERCGLGIFCDDCRLVERAAT